MRGSERTVAIQKVTRGEKMKKIVLSLLFVFVLSTLSFAAPKPWTNEEEKKISLFFSNFAEVFLDDFAENELSDQLMLTFAEEHIYQNRYNKLETVKGEIENFKLIPAKMVDEITLKFFGKKIAKHETEAYPHPEAGGEAYVFAHIYGYEYNEKDDTYTVKGYIIAASSGADIKDPYGDMSKWKKEDKEDISCFYCFEGKIKKSPFDKNRYILLSYKKHEITDEENKQFTNALEGKK